MLGLTSEGEAVPTFWDESTKCTVMRKSGDYLKADRIGQEYFIVQ